MILLCNLILKINTVTNQDRVTYIRWFFVGQCSNIRQCNLILATLCMLTTSAQHIMLYVCLDMIKWCLWSLRFTVDIYYLLVNIKTCFRSNMCIPMKPCVIKVQSVSIQMSPKCADTSVPVPKCLESLMPNWPGHFGPKTLVPKCLGSEVSGNHTRPKIWILKTGRAKNWSGRARLFRPLQTYVLRR